MKEKKGSFWFVFIMVGFVLVAFWSGYRLGRTVERNQKQNIEAKVQ